VCEDKIVWLCDSIGRRRNWYKIFVVTPTEKRPFEDHMRGVSRILSEIFEKQVVMFNVDRTGPPSYPLTGFIINDVFVFCQPRVCLV
jgi:hypothetical protein